MKVSQPESMWSLMSFSLTGLPHIGQSTIAVDAVGGRIA
jgi:hypothetical protein